MGCHALLQGSSLTQGSNPCVLCLLHWQAGSLPLGHLGSPKRKPNAVNTVEGSPHAKCKAAFGRVQRCLSSSRSPGTPSLSVELDRLRNASGGTSPVGQWLRVCTSATGGTGPIPDQETKILHAVQHSKKKKKKKRKKEMALVQRRQR